MSNKQICREVYSQTKKYCYDVEGFRYCKKIHNTINICFPKSENVIETMQRLEKILKGLNGMGERLKK
ncbi:MAG: hypothetical protein COX62_04600 [Deltaproteobacteria bacterium CG_4_10_14_0_2_um_filter_43_8]|nr:MAG: hypothetical protein COV43_04535 [Deltaproteobacteria bacterium CG11_big_fil_rev_8_21_14_0_20_42_23]PJA20525.1 MAG: hypothetical protein COX62_04600 [Deltaproteobacteria bacterium CG_4_10_14_0_2_um_filter_43_8]PJC65042.1 MAG: hypothetical protein CO021_00925 [Deltaproteobacteria bacterium CG_4_9_14_0_2_um_filter_42_21]